MNRTSTDETPCAPCHPNNTHLRLLTNYTQLCNLTSFNTGMPFYCGKPTNKLLSCKNLQRVKMEKCEVLPITDSEKVLFKRGQVTFNQTLKVTVENRREDIKYFSVTDRPSIPCSQYNISRTWHFRRPTGFFYGGKWNLQTCLGVQKQHYMSCLKNRRLYLFGDSTVRQWYEAVIKRFKCKLTSDGFEKCPKCQGESTCVNRDINFKANWYFHAHPIFMGRAWGTTRHWHSISFRIDNLPRNERAIVLIHVYAHVINFHHNVFRQKMEIIRKSVENYLLDSKYSIVLIKAPHAFEGPAGECRLHDYYGDVYSKILFEVFDGLHDKVILLNNRDATLAQHEKLVHPKGNIVNAMIDQMMNFVCY
ncbi:NXPE family member 1-like [Mercenaria mercenaria]|uniref:NXPE family member 1-like n=1 Tax=Mercenaria mercenaria TaxID=6596 RepID=UPI00234ECB01|nr:NXPE family member 1-like [Mercenaria mercenaria]